MGGNDVGSPSERCDKCTPNAIAPNDRLNNILVIGKQSRGKKRAAIRRVDDDVEERIAYGEKSLHPRKPVSYDDWV